MLDKLMIIVLIFLIVTLIYKNYKEEKVSCKEGFAIAGANAAKTSLEKVLGGGTGINNLSTVISDMEVMYPGSVSHTQTLKEDSTLKREIVEPWKRESEWKITDGNDLSYNVYWNGKLKTATNNITDPSGYVLRCIDLVNQSGKKYARIDASGCYGGDNLESNTNNNNQLTISAETVNNIITGKQQRGGYQNITCTIVNEDNKWICASNCVFTGTVAAGSDALGGNNKIIDMADDAEKESGKTWRIPPSSGVIKHGEYHNFKCNAAGSMYGQAGSPDIEPRKCRFGKMQDALPKDRLNCGDAGITRGCKVVTDVNDKSCIPQTKTIDGKHYKYCPILCNPDGLGGSNKCTQHSDCRNHLFKRELNDRERNVPWENPFETDALGYNRIEVDEAGNTLNQDSAMTQAAHYSRLMSSGNEIGSSGPQINTEVLETSSITGLFNHFFTNMKLGDMNSFLKGVESYFSSVGNEQEWMNDNNYGLSESTEQSTVLESETTPFSYKYTQGGTHLLSKDLMMDPRKFKNDNQYIAMARKILYDRKVKTGEKILNPETIPKTDLILLGKIHHKIQILNKELDNKYLSEDGRTELTTKINRLNQKGALLIKDIENREKVFERTVKEERSRPFRQNDAAYVAFKNSGASTYKTTRGQVLNTPMGVGGNF